MSTPTLPTPADSVVAVIDDATDALAEFVVAVTDDLTGHVIEHDALALVIRSAVARHLESVLDGQV